MNKFFIIGLLLAAWFVGCSDNTRAKNFGGTTAIALDKGQKLVNITWKADSMWILTRKMRDDESVEEYSFKEKSSYGVWEGKIVIKESR